jgi:hypothetical protein
VPLYFLFIIKKFNVDYFECLVTEYYNIEVYKSILFNNIPSLLLLVLIIISIASFQKFISESNNGGELPQKFTDIKNIDFNHLTFIATYILPLLAFSLDSVRDAIFIIFLLTFIGIIYIKTNLYYLSPVFIIFGIKVYEATNESNNKVILLTKKTKLDNLIVYNYTKIGEIYFIKENK